MKRLSAKILKQGPLSAKEAEVLRLMAEGYYRPEIADKLHRSLATVSRHVEHISNKLDAHGSTEIVVIAQQLGLIEIHLQHPPLIPLKHLFLIYLTICQFWAPTPRRPARTPTHAVRLARREVIGA